PNAAAGGRYGQTAPAAPIEARCPGVPSGPHGDHERLSMSEPEHHQVVDTDVHYGPATRPQGRLPFSILVRRKYRWWPGPERYGRLIDRLLLLAVLAPGVVWAGVSFGWIPALFVVAELLVFGEIVYRVISGTMLGD